MAHEFKKLGDVEIAEAISESANVLIEEEGNIKRVSKNNVVPNNVALKSDIPEIPDAVINPSSAVVGQTIVVKAVDENGKPTEWECADMSSGDPFNTLYIKATYTDYINGKVEFDISWDELYEVLNNGTGGFRPVEVGVSSYGSGGSDTQRVFRYSDFIRTGERVTSYIFLKTPVLSDTSIRYSRLTFNSDGTGVIDEVSYTIG